MIKKDIVITKYELWPKRKKKQLYSYECSEQKLLLHCRLELMPESPELSLSSAARHIDFHSSRRIYVVLVAHFIALSLHEYNESK